MTDSAREDGGGRVGDDAPVTARSTVRREEELRLDTELHEIGAVRARKRTEVDRVAEVVPREIEDADVERLPAAEGDSGEVETLPDGSVSIPLFEERLVVTKQLFVRERVVVRKRTTSEEQRVEADLRRERIEVSTDGDAVVDDGPGRDAA